MFVLYIIPFLPIKHNPTVKYGGIEKRIATTSVRTGLAMTVILLFQFVQIEAEAVETVRHEPVEAGQLHVFHGLLRLAGG